MRKIAYRKRIVLLLKLCLLDLLGRKAYI